MARPQRNNVDYFPFICKEGDTTKYIDNTYGNDGFATWIKILRALAITDYHYLDLSNRKKLMTLCSTCKVSEEFILNLLNDLSEFNEIDPELWSEKIVWSDRFIESIEDAYSKRSNKIMKKEEFIQMLVSLRTRKPTKGESIDPVNTQSKVEYSIVEETKEEKSKEKSMTAENSALYVWPSFEDFWNLYDKKIDKPKCENKWKKISQRAREKIMDHLQVYVLQTKDKQYRKNPATYLNNKAWENEIIPDGKQQNTNQHTQHTGRLTTDFIKTYGEVLGTRENGQG